MDKAVGKLVVLMVTAFLDMLGLLMVVPLLPFRAMEFLGHGPLWTALNAIGFGGKGAVVSLMIMVFSVAQLIAAPMWGRVSDRYGRRPALMIGMGASAIAFVGFSLANTLELLFLSRIIQGAGGGTVSVVQAYVSDSTEPQNRAKALGWLSAATNAGVAIGPVIGSFTTSLHRWMPGLLAAGLTLVNMAFAWKYLTESNVQASGAQRPKVSGARETALRVATHPALPASRLIWIYAIGMGAFQAQSTVMAVFLSGKFAVTEHTIGWFYAYTGTLAVVMRAVFLGPALDRFREPRLARLGAALLALGLAAMPFAPSLGWFALALGLVPLGTAFTFPCVTGMLSQVIPNHERGLYMGVQQTYGGFARIVGPLWAGLAFDRLGQPVPYLTGAALALLTIAIGSGIERHLPSAKTAT